MKIRFVVIVGLLAVVVLFMPLVGEQPIVGSPVQPLKFIEQDTSDWRSLPCNSGNSLLDVHLSDRILADCGNLLQAGERTAEVDIPIEKTLLVWSVSKPYTSANASYWACPTEDTCKLMNEFKNDPFMGWQPHRYFESQSFEATRNDTYIVTAFSCRVRCT